MFSIFFAIKLGSRSLLAAILLVVLFAFSNADYLVAGTIATRQPLQNVPLFAVDGYQHRLLIKFDDGLQMRAISSGGLQSLARADIVGLQQLAASKQMRFSQLIRLSDDEIEFLQNRGAKRSGIASRICGA